MRYTPKFELDQRVAKLQDKLRQQGIDGVIIVQNADLFYFSGTIQQSHLFVPAEGKPVLMVKKSYERAKQESALDNIVYLDSLKKMLTVLQTYGYGGFKMLGFEMDVLPANLYLSYQKLVSPAHIVDVSPLIRTVRMVKSPYELEILKDVAEIHFEAFSFIRDNLRENISELKLAGMIEAFSREKGHPGLMRIRGFNQVLTQTHVVSGHNTDPSYFWGAVGGKGVCPAFAQGASKKLIGRNESIYVDYGFVLDGYMLDQTRIFCIGKLPDHLVQAYAVAVDILEQMKQLAKPGVACGKLHDLALQIAGESAFSKHFTGFPTPLAFVGHGIGIELDELPVIGHGFETPLEEGMVFALEPKFTFPDGAVGIENTYLVTKDGLETLTV
ncbi:MAG: Xaa-Pro peptidase family protein, partial [Desulfotomaculaceae bacterium]|nr:Xaa-Pro peptidase family protein [Desulfotomaculaceae bacterium]